MKKICLFFAMILSLNAFAYVHPIEEYFPMLGDDMKQAVVDDLWKNRERVFEEIQSGEHCTPQEAKEMYFQLMADLCEYGAIDE